MVNSFSLKFVSSLLLLVSLLPQFVEAKKKKKSHQIGIVRESGVAVYEGRSFDAPIISYLDAGQKVRISKKVYKGAGGFGLFYKVRVKKGLVGFVADTDVIPRFKESQSTKKVKENPIFKEVTKKPEKKVKPIYFGRYVGLLLGSLNFTEIISGRKLKSPLTVFGVKLSGPGFLMDEVPLDFDVKIAMSPPDYYNEQLATAPASGFLLHSSAAIKSPLSEWRQALLFYSLGLMGSYSSFNFVMGSTSFDSQEARVGLMGALSLALRPAPMYLVQFDIKYYYETTQYLGYYATLSMSYD